MDRIHVTEADTALHDLLDRVEGGEEIVLTRNGKDVARLVDPSTPSSSRQVDPLARAKVLRDQVAARGEVFFWDDLKEMRDEGRH